MTEQLINDRIASLCRDVIICDTLILYANKLVNVDAAQVLHFINFYTKMKNAFNREIDLLNTINK